MEHFESKGHFDKWDCVDQVMVMMASEHQTEAWMARKEWSCECFACKWARHQSSLFHAAKAGQ